MDPSFLRPVMASYFARRQRTAVASDVTTVRDGALRRRIVPLAARSVVVRVRWAAGALLMTVGDRIAGPCHPRRAGAADDRAGIPS